MKTNCESDGLSAALVLTFVGLSALSRSEAASWMQDSSSSRCREKLTWHSTRLLRNLNNTLHVAETLQVALHYAVAKESGQHIEQLTHELNFHHISSSSPSLINDSI